MNRRQLLRLHHHLVRHLRHLRHRRPRYQAFVVIHRQESTESGKVSVQHHKDIQERVEEYTCTRLLKCKNRWITTILDGVVL